MNDEQIEKLKELFSHLAKEQTLWYIDGMYKIGSISWHATENEIVAYCTRDQGGYLALSNCDHEAFAVLSPITL